MEEKKNVLLVPSRAIIRQGRGTVVQVLKDGVLEERSIRTGISDYQNTEVIDGLREGEQVVMVQRTSTTTTTPQQRSSNPLIPGRSPGGGRVH